MEPATTLVLLVVGLLLSALFSATETALTALPVSRVQHLAAQKGRLYKVAWGRWQRRPHRMLVTILVGNNVVNIGISAMATNAAITLVGNRGVGLAVGVMTLAVLVFGEITPKTFARIDPERLGQRTILLMGLLDWVLTPVTLPLLGLSQVIARWRRVSLETAPAASSPEDIGFLISLSRQEGHLSEFQHGMVEAVLRIEAAVVREVQVPRTDVVFLRDTLTLPEVRAEVLRRGYSRYPVYHERDDNVIGMLLAKELLRPDDECPDWTACLQPPLYVPESKKVVELLREMRDRRTHVALTVDEYGNIAGLVALEDLIEMIVGDIQDEFDTAGPQWELEPSGSWLVRGSLPVDRLSRLTGKPLPPDEDYTSVAGLLLERAGRVPPAGARFQVGELSFEVVAATSRRIERVRVTITPPPA